MSEEKIKPNSHKYSEINEEKSDKDKSVNIENKPKVVEKKTIGKRFKDTFFAESFKSVADYIVWDVVLPATKDMVLQFVETTLFGRDGSSSFSRRYDRRDSYNTSRTNYSRPSRDYDRQRRTRSSHSMDITSMVFETRRDAESVIRRMRDYAEHYDGVCPFNKFYDFIDSDRPGEWTTTRWGWSWRQLDKARISHRSNGDYYIDIDEPDTYID